MRLIVGGDSAIGMALSAYWDRMGVFHSSSTRNRSFASSRRPYIDLCTKEWDDLDKSRYESVVFCAAQSKIAECELRPQATWRVNVESTAALAQRFAAEGCYVLLLSTAKVFDGTKPMRQTHEHVSPMTEYGRQKAEAERRVLNQTRSGVLRLSKVIHSDLPLLREWELAIQSRLVISAFSDMYLAPVPLADVVLLIDHLVNSESKGIFHLSAVKDISYYDFALDYFKHIDASDNLIRKASARAAGIPEIYLDRYSTLDEQ